VISVIIPSYNSGQTLTECLDAIFSNKFENFEVIIVSDKSTDNSIDIAKNYNCKIIELKENKGPAFARNTGAKSASGDILLFLDSDCIVKNDALINIDEIFKNKKANVVQGVYSHKPNYKSINTQYQQSFYCYYTWQENLDYTDSLTSMYFALKKETFIESEGFNINIKYATAEDEEFGYSLINRGYKISILKKLSVEHKVNYTLLQFIKRNFKAYIDTVRMHLRNKSYTTKAKQKNYSNTLMGIPILGLIIMTLLIIIFYPNDINYYIFLTLNIIFLFLHFKFFNFVKKTKGSLKAFKIIPICYLDTFLMLLSIPYGSILYFIGRKY
jgi:glycosyltransferase involved in cell wall biosynthesis